MSPNLYVTIGGYKSTVAFTGFNFEGPIITAVSPGGSQFGDCINAVNGAPCTETITVTGRNFGPTEDFFMWFLSEGTKTVTEGIAPQFSRDYGRVEIGNLLPCSNAACTTRHNSGVTPESNSGAQRQIIKIKVRLRCELTSA